MKKPFQSVGCVDCTHGLASHPYTFPSYRSNNRLRSVSKLIICASVISMLSCSVNGLQTTDAQERGSGVRSLIQTKSKQNSGQGSLFDSIDVEIVGASNAPLSQEKVFYDDVTALFSDSTTENDDSDSESTETSDTSSSEDSNSSQTDISSTTTITQTSNEDNDYSRKVQQLSQTMSQLYGRSQQLSLSLPTTTSTDTAAASGVTTTTVAISSYWTRETFQSLILIFGFFTFILGFKFLLSAFPGSGFSQDEALKDAFYILFREVAIVVCAAIILEALNYYDIFDIEQYLSTGFMYCILLVLIIWVLFGLAIVVFARSQINSWKDTETKANDYTELEKIKLQYENTYYKNQQQAQTNKFDTGLIDDIKYVVMRLQFVHPIFMPPLTESFLRKDFDFAKYLSYAYGKTIKNFLNLSWAALLIVLVVVGFARFLLVGSQADISLLIAINLLPPIFFLIVLSCFYFKFKSIEKDLCIQIQAQDGQYIRPEEINFHVNYDIVDPFVLYDNIPEPKYLEMSNTLDDQLQEYENYLIVKDDDQDPESSSNNDEEERMSSRSLSQTSPNKKRKIETLYAKVPNKHENLFFCRRSGPAFSHLILQTLYVLAVIYFSCFLTFSCTQFYWKNQDMSDDYFILLFVFLIVVPLILLLLIPILAYKILTKFTIITNIEMMKDRSLVEKVITEQKLERAKRSQRIFQVMKLIRRELAKELKKQIQDKKLRLVTKKHIIQSFQLLGGSGSLAINTDAVQSLISLCGGNLTKQEWQIFLKKAKYNGSCIKYREFTLAVEQILNDVKADPFQLVLNLLRLFFNGEEHVTYERFLTFFGEFVSYFEQSDIDGFLKEVQFIKRESDEVYFQEIASMIRDDVEQFPK